MLSVEYCEAHLIWSMDIFEQVHRGVRFHVLQVIDLGSRVKLEPAVKPGAFTGEEVAEHLNYLMHKHEAPLFLKRDNGSNLNSGEVLSILKMFAVIPFNSPPGFPQFNGVMERSQGEIKRYLRAILKDREELDCGGTSICRTSQSAQTCSAGREERTGTLGRGVFAFLQAGTGKHLSGNQTSGGMDSGDISPEKTTEERRGRARLENRHTALSGKQRIHQTFS